MAASDCPHPLASLKLDIGGTGTRGMASISQVVCLLCNSKHGGPAGLMVIVKAMQADQAELWAALQRAGISRDESPPSAPTSPRAKAGPCPQYIGWLKIESAGVGQRGHSGRVWFRCAGCRGSWVESAGLKLFLDLLRDDRKKIRAALARLGQQV